MNRGTARRSYEIRELDIGIWRLERTTIVDRKVWLGIGRWFRVLSLLDVVIFLVLTHDRTETTESVWPGMRSLWKTEQLPVPYHEHRQQVLHAEVLLDE